MPACMVYIRPKTRLIRPPYLEACRVTSFQFQNACHDWLFQAECSSLALADAVQWTRFMRLRPVSISLLLLKRKQTSIHLSSSANTTENDKGMRSEGLLQIPCHARKGGCTWCEALQVCCSKAELCAQELTHGCLASCPNEPA